MSKPISVLLAEDDEELRFILSRMIAKEGYIVEEISDVATLKRRLRVVLAQPIADREVDIVVSDIYMPGGTVLDVLESLDSRSYYIPIIIITSERDPIIIEKAFQLGAGAVLAKPVDFVGLKYNLRKLVSVA